MIAIIIRRRGQNFTFTDGAYESGSYASEAEAAGAAIRLAQDLGVPYSIEYASARF